MKPPTLVDASDPQLQHPGYYAALALSGDQFCGIVHGAEAAGSAKFARASDALAGMGEIPREEAIAVTLAEVQAHVARMLAGGAGERHPVGSHDLVALRFLVEGRPVTILYVEDRDPPHPCIVDGLIHDRADAIKAWLGDTYAADEPDLYLDS